MNQVEMRKKVADAYPGAQWRKKVEKMSDAQLYATYRRLLSSGRIS